MKSLGEKIKTNVRENPNLKLTNIMEKAHQKWNVGVNKTLLYRAKTLIMDIMEDSFREQYTIIYGYGHELLGENPRSTVKVTTQPFQGGEESIEHPERPMNPNFQRNIYALKLEEIVFSSACPL